MTHDPTFWLLARASGFSAYVLLTMSVLAGLAVKSRPFRKIAPAAQTDTHRAFALAGLSMLVLHGGSLSLDQTVRMPLYALVVPFASTYRPAAVAFGVLAAELMAVIYWSFSLRRKIGTKNWRRLHFLTYLVFIGATAHGLTAGTDTGRTWASAVYLAAAGAVVGATVWRVLTEVPRTKGAVK
jgi:sulfoxide reductase heme-binding subunit YedZ